MAPVIRLRVLPATRSDCVGPGLCPAISCRWHMAHVHSAARRAVKAGDVGALVAELEAMEHTCVLDAADEGERTFFELAEVMGCSRQRAQQIVEGGIRRAQVRSHTRARGAAEWRSLCNE